VLEEALGELEAEGEIATYIQRLRLKGDDSVYFQEPERYFALRFLLHRLDKNAKSRKSTGILFADEEANSKVQRLIQSKLHTYVSTKQSGPYNSPIISTQTPVIFQNSTYSTGIQAADFVAFLYGRILANRHNPKSDFDRIEELSKVCGPVEISAIWPRKK
jgi:hypothetical protein